MVGAGPGLGTISRRQAVLSTACAGLLACVVLLPLLGHKPLAEWDEGIYAEVSREMLDRSWLVPHWNGQLWFEKPPLMLWITAIFFKLFGVTEFWARAGSAFSGVAIVALLHGWLARRRDLLAAWLSSISLLATFGFLHVCHVGEMDVLLSLGVCLALIGLCEVDPLWPSGWYLFWIGFAIALMTKGAASVVIPVAAVVFALAQRWSLKHFGRAFAFGLALFLLLTLPWHLAMAHRFGRGFLDEYLGLHVLARATRQIEHHATHWWYYLMVLLVSAPPFVLLYPVAAYRGLRRAELRAWAIFAAVVVAFFTAIQTRLPHYVAPAYPALSLLTAVYLADFLRTKKNVTPTPRLLLFTAAIWAGSILATHSSLKRLHSADLDGTILLDNKEADTLLRHTPLPAGNGPLLLWREGPVQSVATVIFYARRPVQQVVVGPQDPAITRNKYRADSRSLSDVVGATPRLILLDKSLLPQLPAQYTFRPLQESEHMALGIVGSTPQS